MQSKKFTQTHIRWLLVVYDIIIYALSFYFLVVRHPSIGDSYPAYILVLHATLSFVPIFLSRFLWKVYSQIWRYGSMSAYLRLLVADMCGSAVYVAIEILFQAKHITFIRSITLCSFNLLGAIAARMVYYYMYQRASEDSNVGFLSRGLIGLIGHMDVKKEIVNDSKKVKIAILGAGRLGASLAEDLIQNTNSPIAPVCFLDIDEGKIGRSIAGIRVFREADASEKLLKEMGVQEVVFAFTNPDTEAMKNLYHKYKISGFKIKTYDYPRVESVDAEKRTLREFDIEDLLFRAEQKFDKTPLKEYYKDKVVLVTGGGGSIGSEIGRQLAKLDVKKIVLLDIFENGAYDLQQELKIKYGREFPCEIEIASVTNKKDLVKIFSAHKPNVIVHCAAHKHVPLMEHNACEAIWNNVFGTLNCVEAAEECGADAFIMVSTDKAVNPTNVMGATKRVCEMIVLNRNNGKENAKTKFSATRFGNVLGSNGSVIPLFKRQIAEGGPITITDRNIIRYFMTIPEASRLVLMSGAMAKDGQLFVLDMGKPVKIYDLAESMIRFSGLVPGKDIQIVETGLRPGEKLYEELLTKSETLGKTENEKIFTEVDANLSADEIDAKLSLLQNAVDSQKDKEAVDALIQTVPTFKHNGGGTK